MPNVTQAAKQRRYAGALTAAWVEFPRQSVRWTGPGGAPPVYRSSDYSSRSFCPTCGSTLGAIDDKPVIALLLGAFDAPNRKELMPTYHSFRAARPKWWHIDTKPR